MTQSTFRGVTFALATTLTAGLSAALVGCGGSGGDSANGPGIAVIYESDPLADVQVRLHDGPDGPVLTQAVSATDGVARFADVPSPEPDRYHVSLASIGDGGWILDPQYLKPADSGLTLHPLATAAIQQIKLPSGAVRPLLTTNRR